MHIYVLLVRAPYIFHKELHRDSFALTFVLIFTLKLIDTGLVFRANDAKSSSSATATWLDKTIETGSLKLCKNSIKIVASINVLYENWLTLTCKHFNIHRSIVAGQKHVDVFDYHVSHWYR